MNSKTSLFLILLCLITKPAFALFCQEPIDIQQTGRDVSVKVEGEMSGLAKKIIGAGLGVEVDTKIKDLLHKYPDINKLILETRLSYEICKSIESIPNIKEEEKIDKYLKFKGKSTSAFGQSLSTLAEFDYCEADQEYLKSTESNRIYKHGADGTIFVLKDCSYSNFSLSCEMLIYNCSEMGIPNSVKVYNGGSLIASHMQLPFQVSSISVHGKSYTGTNHNYYPNIEILPGRKVVETITFSEVTNKVKKGIDKIQIPFKTKKSNGWATFSSIKLN